jgi:hypothetical protein
MQRLSLYCLPPQVSVLGPRRGLEPGDVMGHILSTNRSRRMFTRIEYSKLNAKHKENYNFQKVAARLADFGYNSMRLSDDYEGADFIALHNESGEHLLVQLKGRLSFDSKYYGKKLHIAFRVNEDVYIYPHDELRKRIVDEGLLEGSKSVIWVEFGSRSWRNIPVKLQPLLDDYKLLKED